MIKHLVWVAWLYVVLMMSVAEAFSPQGGWLGATVTFVLYGVVPMVIMGYIMDTPARRERRRRQEHSGTAQEHAEPPDNSSHVSDSGSDTF